MHEPSVWQALVLGTLQGLTEFLPVSSSAHLSLTPWVLGWQPAGLAFDVALHLGTLVALVWYFRAEWLRLAVGAITLLRQRRPVDDASRQALFIVIATIPAGIAGLALEDLAETAFRAPIITAIALVVMGAALWAVDAKAGIARAREQMTARDALLVGLAQCLALVPGVSRSGATITAGRALGFDRSSAAVFSFLMSLPIISAAAIFKVPDALRETGLSLPLVVGIAAAAASSWVAIAVLLRFVRSRSYAVFAVYRFALAAVIFALIATRGGW
ncbi:MAG: undecaprenyl-diphosphate phosphatase [Gemmatimonadaceae bacterium]|nr:undecaprenyl-diphosphate phosphatase [Gemmatimonadaceae bacterium]MCW5825037.1 undecaprenyl-diphosphate phosphatase [Gemmatimonadaceae bacterium]